MSKKTRTTKGSGIGTLITLVVVILFGAVYSLLGSDPLELSSPEASATPILAAPTQAPTEISITEVMPTLMPLPVTETAITELPPTEAPTALVETSTAIVEAPTLQAATSLPAQPTQTPTPAWWQVYFVNPIKISETNANIYSKNGIPAEMMNGSIAEKLIQNINRATKSIHIASYEFDLTDVANALIQAKQRGVDVRWITDDEAGIEADTKPGHGQFKMLEDAGIPIIDDKRGGLMHHKFWIFDGQTTWTGSTNITISGVFQQNNNVIVVESPELASIYERQFEDMWSGKFNAKSPSTIDQQKLTVNGTNIQVLFSPEDNAISHILPYIQQAQNSVYFMAFTFTHPDLGNAMLQKAQAGVTVSGVFETTGSDSEYGQMVKLFCNKVPVRQDGNGSFMHSKTIIVDERYVITGSLNFTDNANKTNNENVIILDNPTLARLYIEEFQRVWAAGKDPNPAKITCK